MTSTIQAVLVEFSASQWTGRKLDRKVSLEIDTAKQTKTRAGNYNKNLFADCAELEAVTRHISKVRAAHIERTLPWYDSGARLLPTAAFNEYHAYMAQQVAEADVLFRAFFAIYDTHIAKAAFTMGDLFDRSEYPPLDTIESRFNMKVNYHPLPQAGDFRIDQIDALQVNLRDEYDKMYADRLAAARRDVWERFSECVTRLVERLGTAPDGRPNIFRDSLVENALDLVNSMDTFNVEGDPELTAARHALAGALMGVTPKELRENTAVRDEVRKNVASIMDKFGM